MLKLCSFILYLICKELPKEVQYLIVGAGTAAFAAYRAIRAADVKAKVPQ